jgi:hypothetical protein
MPPCQFAIHPNRCFANKFPIIIHHLPIIWVPKANDGSCPFMWTGPGQDRDRTGQDRTGGFMNKSQFIALVVGTLMVAALIGLVLIVYKFTGP